MARSYAPDVSGDHQALVEQISAERQRVPEPAPVPVPVPVSMSATSSTPNKLRRRTVSGPTPSSSFTQPLKSNIPAPSASGSNTVTATLQGEDPLKRMKYDLQVTTFLLNKLKSSSSNPNPPRHYEPPPKQPHPRPLRQVDPRNLVDPWIDGRHGTEFHQIHNHGLLLHPSYGGGYPYQPSAQSRSALDPRRTQTPAPAVDKRVNQWVDEHSGGGGRRKRYASDAAAHRPAHPPPVTSYHRPSTSTSSHTQFVPPPHPPPGSSRSSGSSRAEDHYHHYPSSSQPQPQPPPVFGNFRQPSYSYTPAQGQPSGSGGGRHKKRQSMPVTLRPETIMPTLEPETIVPLDPVDAHYRMGNVDSSGGGPRRVRFRGADSVIGSPSPRKAVFTSLPQRGR
ncbi:hypothetical protein CC2G_000083 [Coprinopsis cinerea AmutBmut pab1-1]|nr:hypothetical protein CC2G_000083 [Coprinopsis cinerea AmutBmut pab1-1]